MNNKEKIHKELEDYILSKLSELNEVTGMRVCDVDIDYIKDIGGNIQTVFLEIKYE